LQVPNGTVDDASPDAPSLVRIADEERVVADDVDHPRDSGRILADSAYRRFLEEIDIARAADPKARSDVVACFLLRHWRNRTPQADSLLQLSQFGQLKPFLELRLADEQYLQQLVGRRLEVREEADLLERCGF